MSNECFYCGSAVGQPHKFACPLTYKKGEPRRKAIRDWVAGRRTRNLATLPRWFSERCRRSPPFLLGYTRCDRVVAPRSQFDVFFSGGSSIYVRVASGNGPTVNFLGKETPK